MTIKAIFFDIDGTLYSYKTNSVPHSVFTSFELARRKGIKLIAATGRNLSAPEDAKILDLLPTFDAFVVLSGALSYTNTEIIDSHPIEPSDVKKIISCGFPCIIQQNGWMCVTEREQKIVDFFHAIKHAEPNLQQCESEIYQITFFLDQEKTSDFENSLKEVKITRWDSKIADAFRKGVGKHVGVQKMCEYFGIKVEEAMAFGDTDADISMIQAVGIGVAVGNASHNLKQVAKYVSHEIDHDGIYLSLRYFGII